MESVCDTCTGDFPGDTNHHDPDAIDEDGQRETHEEDNPAAPSRPIGQIRECATEGEEGQEMSAAAIDEAFASMLLRDRD